MRHLKQCALIAIAGFLLLMSGLSAHAAEKLYVTITAQKQGLIKGFNAAGKESDRVEATSFAYEIDAPFDAQTGQASGKRQHKPIVFSRRSDSASPKLFQALTTNEVLTSVKFEFVKSDLTGKETTVYKIDLTNARIVKLEQKTGSADQTLSDTVTLAFQKVDEEYVPGAITAGDSWTLQP